jgi:hypothetical protein
MADTEWFRLLTAAFGGGLIVKALDILYQEIRRLLERSQSARRFVDEHLDPLLKAGDELVGKLRSLAEEDFKPFRDVGFDLSRIDNHDFSGLLFLLARFWAQIEIIRQEGLSVSIAKDVRGRRLQNFFDCLESRRVRIVDRISQRAVGELMLIKRNGKYGTKTFIDFIHSAESDAEVRRWLEPAAKFLSRAHHTTERQKLLLYGAVIHALIDTLDHRHEVTRERPSYPNKLSKKTWRDLKYRVFGQYLSFIEPSKYLGPPKRRP